MTDPIRVSNAKTKPIDLSAPAPKAGPVVPDEPVEPDAAALDAAWAEHRRRQGMCGVGTPIQRPKGWKP